MEILSTVLLLPFFIADSVGEFRAFGWWFVGAAVGLMVAVVLLARWQRNAHRAAEAIRARVARAHREAAEKRTHEAQSRPTTFAG